MARGSFLEDLLLPLLSQACHDLPAVCVSIFASQHNRQMGSSKP